MNIYKEARLSDANASVSLCHRDTQSRYLYPRTLMTSSSIKTVTSADLERKSLDSDIKDDASLPPTATMTNRRRSANSDVDRAATTYPRIAESAPFPALGSVHEVSRIMTRESEVQGQPKDDNASAITEKGGDANEKPWELPIETEGWRNPGWFAVIATFLVNFTVFGNSFSWGNFQRLQVSTCYWKVRVSNNACIIGTLKKCMQKVQVNLVYPLSAHLPILYSYPWAYC